MFIYKIYAFIRWRLVRVVRGQILSVFTGHQISCAGMCFKFINPCLIKKIRKLRVGDGCWIEAVSSYMNVKYNPKLTIGNNVSLSDYVHISCVNHIEIGSGVLIGSKVYIGDHSHGGYKRTVSVNLDIPPAFRCLGDHGSVIIGNNCWIGDNAVILANVNVAAGSVIGANSVVKNISTDRSAIIAGIPAKIIRYL